MAQSPTAPTIPRRREHTHVQRVPTFNATRGPGRFSAHPRDPLDPPSTVTAALPPRLEPADHLVSHHRVDLASAATWASSTGCRLEE